MNRSLVVAAVLILSAGCQAPRLITSMTAVDSQMKMVYSQAGGSRTGVLQCDIAADGSLENCRAIPVTFNDSRN